MFDESTIDRDQRGRFAPKGTGGAPGSELQSEHNTRPTPPKPLDVPHTPKPQTKRFDREAAKDRFPMPLVQQTAQITLKGVVLREGKFTSTRMRGGELHTLPEHEADRARVVKAENDRPSNWDEMHHAANALAHAKATGFNFSKFTQFELADRAQGRLTSEEKARVDKHEKSVDAWLEYQGTGAYTYNAIKRGTTDARAEISPTEKRNLLAMGRTMRRDIQNSAPLKADAVVYRGARTSFLGAPEDAVGQTFIDKGFLSTTRRPHEAGMHGKQSMFRMLLPAGMKVGVMKTHTGDDYEAEWVLPPGCRMTVVAVEHMGEAFDPDEGRVAPQFRYDVKVEARRRYTARARKRR